MQKSEPVPCADAIRATMPTTLNVSCRAGYHSPCRHTGQPWKHNNIKNAVSALASYTPTIGSVITKYNNKNYTHCGT